MNTWKRYKGHVLAALCAVVWGVTFVASKRLLQDYTPAQLMFMRFVIAYVVLWILHPKWIRPTFREERLYFFMGLTGCTLYFWLENTAITLTLTANVSTIVAMAPLFTAILSHFFSGGTERLNRWIWIGFVIAFTGVILVVFNGTFILKLSPAGDILSFLTAFVWAVFSVLQVRALKKRSSLFVTRKVMFYGIVTSLPIMLVRGFHGFSLRPAFATGTGVLCLLFLAVFGSALCYLAWSTAQRELGAVVTSNYIYAIPFVTLVAGAVFLHERISAAGVLGAVFIVAGVWISSRRKRPGGKEKEA